MSVCIPLNGTFTVHGNGTGTGNWTGKIGDIGVFPK